MRRSRTRSRVSTTTCSEPTGIPRWKADCSVSVANGKRGFPTKPGSWACRSEIKRSRAERGEPFAEASPAPGSEHLALVDVRDGRQRLARRDEIARDHLGVGHAGPDHRVDAGIRVDD